MTTDRPVSPDELERLLSGRSETDGDDLDAISPEDVSPRQLLAIATTSHGHLEAIQSAFDWETVREALDDLPEDQQAQWLRTVIGNLGTRTGAGIEAEAAIRTIGQRAFDLRHRHPHLLISYLHELTRLLRVDQSDEALDAAEEQFQHLAAEIDSVAGERISDFRQTDVRDRLVDPTLRPKSRAILLEQLADDSLDTYPPDLVLDVLYPLRNDNDPAVERAALATIESWAAELTSQSVPADVVETLERTLAGDQENLPEPFIVEILVSGYVAPAVISWLTSLRSLDDRQAVVEAAFRALQPISGIRAFADDLCEFILERPLEDDAMHAGIEVLGSILVGLAPYQHTEQPAQDDHIRQVLFTDDELASDHTIRQTLQTIAADTAHSPAVRERAVRTWLSVRPPEIQTVLWDIDPDDIGDDPVTAAKLDAAAKHRLIEFVDVVHQLWEETPDEAATCGPLIETLSNLETREIVDVLLEPAFDHDEKPVREDARAALVEAGYEAEVRRERRRRTVLGQIEDRFDEMTAATETDRELRDRKANRLRTEDTRQRARVRAAKATSRSVDLLTEFRARGTSLVFRLVAPFRELERLAGEIDILRDRQAALLEQIQEARDTAQYLATEIETVETEIDETERKLEEYRDERDDLQSKISDLEYERDDLQAELEGIEDRLHRHDMNEPNGGPPEDDAARSAYHDRLNDWKRKRDRIASERDDTSRDLEGTESELRSAGNRLTTLEKEIPELETALDGLHADQRQLSSELDESMARLHDLEPQLRDVEDELQILYDEYNRCQERIDALVTELSGLRADTETERDQLTSTHSDASSDAKDARASLRSLVTEQGAAAESRREHAERIQELEATIDDGHQLFETAGERTRVESNEADDRAFQASRHAAVEQYDENVGRWRLDSILRRTIETETLEDSESDLAERARQATGNEQARDAEGAQQ